MTTDVGAPLFERALIDAAPVDHLCDLSIDLEPTQIIGTPVGTRFTYIVKGGRFTGPRLQGSLLPGGGDWATVGSDGIGRLDVHATLRTDDGAFIHYESRGVAVFPPDGRKRLADGERIPFEESYIRMTPKFETADPNYTWVNGLVILGYAELSKGHFDHRMYRVY
ncbi:DUF3237 domain-containing protein [Nocardia altamirensis]|uniref:DUF3237 domain-containing protein n=1 Tax=Nocardia altamirensis TaxID=472158 RepID=UPI0008405497|nr:DUF3237 domain-containing protein [Nocardia altamirensis]